jgi:thiamine biosynthesis lipoprotein
VIVSRRRAIAPIAEFIAPEPPAFRVGDRAVVHYSRRAMATRFEVILPYGTPDGLTIAEAALDEIDDCETWMTVYSDDSEVSQVNREAFQNPVPVSEPLFDLLSLSARLTNESGGAFDPAIGAMIKAWGFYRREGRLPSPRERAAAMQSSGMRHVVLDEINRTVRFLRPGLQLNFGSIGKGFALDRAAAILASQFGITSALLHGGGSSVRAIGRWPIRLNHPEVDGQSLTDLPVTDAGFGTTAATFQFFVYKNTKYGHVLDPRTGQPAHGTKSASVRAATAAEADALSTAAFVVGSEETAKMIRHRPDAGAILLTDDDRLVRLPPPETLAPAPTA